MNDRERFLSHMNYEKTDEIPFHQWFSPWPETLHRWYREGLPPNIDLNEYFGFNKVTWVPIDLGPIPRFVPKVLEETDEYRIEITYWGVKQKVLKKHVSMPAFIEHPVKTWKDWEEMKKRFDPYDERRYPKEWGSELLEYYETIDCPVGIGYQWPVGGFFAFPRVMLGLERMMLTLFKDPDLIHDIINFWADFLIKATQEAVENAKIDFANIWEDMAYKKGPHISPKMFREFMLQPYKKLTDFLKRNGIEIIMVDTDGNHDILNNLFLESGVNCLWPLEAAAGEDVIEIRKKFGKELRLFGNIDKQALARGKKAIKAELERKMPVAQDGGYIPSIDHSIPPDVSWENYCYYIKLLKKYSRISK